MASSAAGPEGQGGVGEVYLSAEQIATRVAELGREVTADYEGREPLLVGALKACFVFIADLSRALPFLHHVDFVELAGYSSDETGRVTEAFSPDFYLPDQDLYLEVTVMKQSLVTRKNRKLRKLRERYPDVRIKLFYKRDLERLARHFRLDLAS